MFNKARYTSSNKTKVKLQGKITSNHEAKVCWKIMALSIMDYTHHQGDVRYGKSSGIQCFCVSLISVTWKLFRSPGIWDKFNLDCILSKGDQLFKFIGKFRYLRMEDLPQEFLVEKSSINVVFL